MKRVFVSMPMKGKSEEEIRDKIRKIELIINDFEEDEEKWEYRVIDSVVSNYDKITCKNKNKPVFCLSYSIKCLADADIAYFAEGWENARGCKIEHEIAKQYGIEIKEK